MALKLSYQLMDADEVRRTLDALADQIVAANPRKTYSSFWAFNAAAFPMAQRMAEHIASRTGKAPEMGILDINPVSATI
jgi:pyrimidine operon attenuation protein/uracil phosphoribosyltransferase